MSRNAFTKEEEDLLLIQGMIATMPSEVQQNVVAVVGKIQDMKAEHTEEAVHLAIALCGAKLAAEQED